MKSIKSLLILSSVTLLIACEPPATENAGPPPGSLVGFRNDIGKWGFTKNGKEVIKPQYDGVMPFRNGIARVRVGDHFGFIKESGEYLIEPKFAEANVFVNGLAPAKIGPDDKWGFINEKGEMALEAKYDSADIFSDGFAVVQLGDKLGYIDTKGAFTAGPPPGELSVEEMAAEEAADAAAEKGEKKGSK